MRGASVLALLLVSLPLAAQRFPNPGELAGKRFFVSKTWIVGGVGNGDCLTMDLAARRLNIAHGPSVQIVDLVGHRELRCSHPRFMEANIYGRFRLHGRKLNECLASEQIETFRPSC